MDARDFANVMRAKIALLQANRPKEVLIIGQELKTAMQLRIQTKGQNDKGTPFDPYNPQYAEARKKKGRQIARVDFTVTGQLWGNIRPVIISNTPLETVVEIGPTNADNEKKLLGALRTPITRPRGTGAPRGKILTPNKKERKMISEANRRRLLKYLT